MYNIPVNKIVSKYDGLKKLEILGFPHPDWRFVNNINSLPAMPWCVAVHGWTIRCVPKSSYIFGLPSRHMVDFNKINSSLCELRELYPEIKDHVVYPSWVFDISGTCLVKPDQILIEMVNGDIAPLLSGKVNPDAVYIFSFPYYQNPTFSNGDVNIIQHNELINILSYTRRIKIETEVILEWTKTTDGKLFFHDWFEMIKPTRTH